MNLKLLWYCTKNKPYLFDCYQGTLERCAYVTSYSKSFKNKDYVLNGKIVAESDYDVEEIVNLLYKVAGDRTESPYQTNKLNTDELLKRSHLSGYMIRKYNPNYAIHVKNLHIFEKPKEISDYYKTFERIFYRHLIETHSSSSAIYIPESNIYFMDYCDELKKAPQNMMYVYDKDGVKYVLISIHPEWLCLILNGLKDVELRRKVLKEMM